MLHVSPCCTLTTQIFPQAVEDPLYAVYPAMPPIALGRLTRTVWSRPFFRLSSGVLTNYSGALTNYSGVVSKYSGVVTMCYGAVK